MKVETLDGRPVFLILVARNAADATFLPGVASWDALNERLSLTPSTRGPVLSVAGTPEALKGFDPTVLPRLIVAEFRDAVLALAAGAEACIVAFSDALPAGAATYRYPFFGVGANTRTGEVFLFQGSDHIESDDEDDMDEDGDADAPWAAEPWSPDAPAT